MTENDLINKLHELGNIVPSDEYARSARRSVMALTAQDTAMALPAHGIFARGLNATFSLALTAAFLLVLILGGSAGIFKAIFLPPLNGVGSKGLMTEADSISKDIDIRLEEIEYFGRSGAPAANRILSEKTSAEIEEAKETDEQIDQLLDDVLKY